MPGVPGGIERHVEELYPRLAKLGVDVTVYARREYVPEHTWVDGVRVVSLRSVGGRYGEALSHTTYALLHASLGRYDLVHMHAIGPGVTLPLARLLGLRPSVFTFHSFDYLRSKWGPRARAFLRFSERVSVRYADAIIAVSEAGRNHIARTYGRRVTRIPNGPGNLRTRPPGTCLARLGLQGRPYILSVGRLSPEKCLEDVITAARRAVPDVPLVLAGDTSYTDEYISSLRSIAGPQVVFPGYVHGADLEELYSSALVYVIASEIEGLSVSLLEAMSLGCPVIASDIPGNREALGAPAAGLTFAVHDTAALEAAMKLLADDAPARAEYADAARRRVREEFDWDAAARATLEVYEHALHDSSVRRTHRNQRPPERAAQADNEGTGFAS
ncbi:MAG: glycosyltransferase family 4 protein [Thermoleophilia bacterium]